MAKTSFPRIIPVPHTAIEVGDAVELSWTIGDIDRSSYGRITRIHRRNGYTEYLTPRGYIMLTVYTGGSTEPKNIEAIRICSRNNMAETSLPGLDELLADVKEIENDAARNH